MASTVSGSATVGGAAYNVSAPITLPAAPAATACNLGIYDPADDYPSSWTGIQAFTAAGCPVKVGTYYCQWQGPYPQNFATLCHANGVTPFIELEPWFTSTTWPAFTNIAAGQYDSWLQSMAASVKAGGYPVMMTYAHEMNGSWYPWGNGGPQNVTAAQWIASWQHVVTTMNTVAPGLITWVWAPNNADVGSVVPYWPGQSYIGLAAYDGYIQNTSQTFASFQQQTVTQIRSLTSGPIWNSECGVEPAGNGRAAVIAEFVKAMQGAGLSGFNWFNQSPFNLTSAETSTLAAAVSAWNAA